MENNQTPPVLQEIIDILKQQGIPYFISCSPGDSRTHLKKLMICIDGKLITYDFTMSCREEDGLLEVYVPSILRIPEERKPEALRFLNRAMERYNYCKFGVSGEGFLSMHYALLPETKPMANSAILSTCYMTTILNKVYEPLMKILWAGKTLEELEKENCFD